MKVCVMGVLPSSLINFRGELIKLLVNRGHDVITMASGAMHEEVDQIERLGAKYIDFPVQRNSLSPFSDVKTLLSIAKVFRREKPDLVIAYTIKPVIWGGIAARFFSKAKFYGLITGLGFAFQESDFKRSLLTRAVCSLYRISLRNACGTIFQNSDNLETFVEKGIVNREKTHWVYGSGVKLDYYSKTELPSTSPVFLSVARLLGEKGLREYAAAAKIVKKQHPDISFRLVGPSDSSPDRIPLQEVNSWQRTGCIEYLGEKKDVRASINNCHVFVLASYHEGMPRSVLEAMAIGRPILTTNVPGCKDTVVPGENGYLVEKGSVDQLVDKMLWFIDNRAKWQYMADRSHEIAIETFDVRKVNNEILKIIGVI